MAQARLEPDGEALMADEGSMELGEDQRAVLLKDLENWSESFWKNEEAGERRVQFLITLVTAVMGGLVALYQYNLDSYDKALAAGRTAEDPARVVLRVGLGALTGLFLVGVVTFLRMVKRNRVTDEYKVRADAIRRMVLGKRAHDWLYDPRQLEPHEIRETSGEQLARSARKVLSGGLVQMVAAMNSLVAAILLGLWAAPADAKRAWPIGIASFVIVFAAHLLFAASQERDAEAQRDHLWKLRDRHRWTEQG